MPKQRSKPESIKLRLGAEELASWRAAAKGEGKSLSAWMRDRCAVRTAEPVRIEKVSGEVPAWAKNYPTKTLADFEVLYGRKPQTEVELASFAKRGW